MGSGEFAPRNRLLAAMPREVLWRLRPHLTPVYVARGTVLCEADESRRRVYFVERGVTSLVTENGASVVIAAVGSEGAVGGPTPLLGGGIAFGRYQMLVSGSALAMEASHFRIALREISKLRSLCEAYTQAFFAQVLQNLLCSRLHSAEQRCARWLVMCDDQIRDDRLELGQDSLAAILGVPQLAADALTSRLRQVGLIRHREGLITILDRGKLEAAACLCYRTLRDYYYDRPLAPANTS